MTIPNPNKEDNILLWATTCRFAGLVTLLLQHDADTEIKNSQGETPLYSAVTRRARMWVDLPTAERKRNLEIINSLLYSKADIDTQTIVEILSL